MTPLEKQIVLNQIWKRTHRDYRGYVGGERCILTLRDGGTRLVPLQSLTNEEIARELPKVGTSA